MRLQAETILMREDSAFADDDSVRWNFRTQSFAHVERYFEGSQIAVVDADHPGLERQRPGKFGFVMHLDKNVHAKIMRRRVKLLASAS